MTKAHKTMIVVARWLVVAAGALIFGPFLCGRLLGPVTSLGRLIRVARDDNGFGVTSRGESRVWVLGFQSKASAIITDENRHLIPQERIAEGYLVPGEVFETMAGKAVDIIRANMSRYHVVDSEGKEHELVSASFGPTDAQMRIDTRKPELYFSLPRRVWPRYVRYGYGGSARVGIPFVMISVKDHLKTLGLWPKS